MQVGLGVSDFRKLREEGLEYVDKSQLIVELIDRRGVEVVLLPRPRRFGKTLNLSMLRCYFERSEEDLSHLFEDLAVWRAGDEYRKHFQRYPVIYLTFQGIGTQPFDACWRQIKQLVRQSFAEHAPLLLSGVLDDFDRRAYEAVLDDSDNPTLYYNALGDLSRYLRRATSKRTFIFIDDYDEPFRHGQPEFHDFFRTLLAIGLKDNPHLHRAVLTGVLSTPEFANTLPHTLLHRAFKTAFGFTEPEVMMLLDKCGRHSQLNEMRRWYGGYSFGGEEIYNPWSVTSLLARNGETGTHWLHANADDAIQRSLSASVYRLQRELETDRPDLATPLYFHAPFARIGHNVLALRSALVFAGYLRADAASPDPRTGEVRYSVSVPNLEAHQFYIQACCDHQPNARGSDNPIRPHRVPAQLDDHAQPLALVVLVEGDRIPQLVEPQERRPGIGQVPHVRIPLPKVVRRDRQDQRLLRRRRPVAHALEQHVQERLVLLRHVSGRLRVRVSVERRSPGGRELLDHPPDPLDMLGDQRLRLGRNCARGRPGDRVQVRLDLLHPVHQGTKIMLLRPPRSKLDPETVCPVSRSVSCPPGSPLTLRVASARLIATYTVSPA
ncbi:MAG: AAA family ATPase [Deltaproteobacteria bacterium]|nr:AAA family ATPase [Deltaproteobacteria bacterium]